jgi:hypothetical protein
MGKSQQEKPDSRTLIIVAIIGTIGVIIASLAPVFFSKERNVPVAPPEKALVLDSMESTLGWSVYTDGKSATSIALSSAPGFENNGIKASYTIGEWGWVGTFREINIGILEGTDAIRLSYQGSGAPNSIELKLLMRLDNEETSAVFSVIRNQASNSPEWRTIEAGYHEFVCWTDTGCKIGERIDLSKVWRIDIAISNKGSDSAGSGIVIFDDLVAIAR